MNLIIRIKINLLELAPACRHTLLQYTVATPTGVFIQCAGIGDVPQ